MSVGNLIGDIQMDTFEREMILELFGSALDQVIESLNWKDEDDCIVRKRFADALNDAGVRTAYGKKWNEKNLRTFGRKEAFKKISVGDFVHECDEIEDRSYEDLGYRTSGDNENGMSRQSMKQTAKRYDKGKTSTWVRDNRNRIIEKAG
jgi:hypothetical protein